MTTSCVLIPGDCRAVLSDMHTDSIDAIVCDPPYELKFMGSAWDKSGIAFDRAMWYECLRVLKPGGHLLAFGGTRTFHRMAVAIEDAGFEMRDCLSWLYGQGFPKSLDVSKAIDKAKGATREVVGTRSNGASNKSGETLFSDDAYSWSQDIAITTPATSESEQWAGWGTSLKPSWEPIIMARKPLIGTVAFNVMEHGTGAINIDGCRIGRAEGDRTEYGIDSALPFSPSASFGSRAETTAYVVHTDGRWPANLLLDEEAARLLDEQSGIQKGGFVRNRTKGARPFNNNGADTGYETTAVIDEPDGGASRFFYVAKATKKERNAGLDGTFTPHATVKPIALMQYLVRLVTPPGGVVLDPFMGSGSTGIAAQREGFAFVGIDLSEEYVRMSQARIDYDRQENPHGPS